MADNGIYGTKKPAFITSDDVDIFYHYRPTRSTDSNDFSVFKQLDSSNLTQLNCEEYKGDTTGIVLPGMYNLRLPVSEFGNVGIYTVYIKPKEIDATIIDVSTLSAYPGVRGIVFNSEEISTSDTSIFNNGGLVGYRVEYFNNGKRSDMTRIITSSNRCEPNAQNFNNTSENGTTYSFNDSSNWIFCTVTPSVAMSFNSNSTPSIGASLQTVKLVSTKFNPLCIEIEMTEHDIEDVATMLENDQLRNLDHGLITTFNADGEIYHQAEYGHIVNKSTGLNSDFKVTKNKNNIIMTEEDNMKKVKEQL